MKALSLDEIVRIRHPPGEAVPLVFVRPGVGVHRRQRLLVLIRVVLILVVRDILELPFHVKRLQTAVRVRFRREGVQAIDNTGSF
jgi:hypothetical protein